MCATCCSLPDVHWKRLGSVPTGQGQQMDHDHLDDTAIGPDGSVVRRPARIVDFTTTMTTAHSGSICVHAGTFTLAPGTIHNGSLHVRDGARVEILGTHNGSLHVSSGAVVTITGSQNGSCHVSTEALIEVRSTGRLAGSLAVAGRVANAGVRGGSVSDLGGTISDVNGGRVRQPERSSDGTSLYRW